MRFPREVDAPERRAAHRRRVRWGRFRRWGLGAAALGLPFAVLPTDQAKAQALPTGGNVVGGSGTISQTSANQLTINQNSATLSIDWQSFSVGAGNIVRFIQPDSSSLALNRVIGPDPSMIFGSIQANGRVVIMNPAGIFFGPTAMVDVNGLVATTSRMSQADFLAGNLNFSIAGDVNARVINEGFVNVAQGGFAVLSAAAVENKGTIVAQGGTVVLAGTPTFTLDFFGDGLLKFASTGTVNQAPTGANALVENSGTIQADGGRVLMTARAARDVINNVINVTGIVEARSARIENGEIVIDGGENGTTVVAGRLDVSGNEADAKGGNVTVLGGRVELAAGTDIRASGEAGGGTVLVGGGQHGQGTAYNAQTLYMDAAAVIDANATLNGNGGKVVLWADDTARMEGTITARGGTIAGDGGFVETSGKNKIAFGNSVAVDTRAFNGRDGTLLIDPTDFTIATFGGDMSPAVLLGLLATNDITIDSATGGSGTAGNINVDDAIVYTGFSTRTLTLNAQGSINISAGISATNLNINLVLQAAGDVFVDAAINTNNGYLTTAGYNGVGALGGSFVSSAAISLSNAALTLNTTGLISIGGTVTTAGTVTLNAGGAVVQTYGITGGASLVIGGTGAVTLNDPTNAFINLTLNRTGTATNVSLVNSNTAIVQTSTLGTGSFYLSGVGFAQTGTITQDALADSFTIQGNAGNVTLSQANTFTGDVTLLGGNINVTANQSFNIASSAVLNLLSAGNIVIDKSLTATGPGAMSMIFNARSGGAATGYIDIQPTNSDITISTNGGYIVMGGGTGGLTDAMPTQSAIGGGGLVQGISIRGYNDSGTARGVTIATGGGNFYARGTGAASGAAPAGVYLYSTAGGGGVSISTGAGNIAIAGYGGNGNDGSGVFMQGDTAGNRVTLQTTSGDITINGDSGPGASSHGILAAYYSDIATGSGDLSLTGISTGSGFSRGIWSLGVIDAGSGGTATIDGNSSAEYGILAMPGADWRTANNNFVVTGLSTAAGAGGVGMDAIAFTANSGTFTVYGEGGAGSQAINLSGAITFAGSGGAFDFNATGAIGGVVVSGTLSSTGTTGTRNLSIVSTSNVDIQGTPSATTIGASTGGMLNFSAEAGGTLTLGGKIVTEGGNVSLIAGTKATIHAGIETFGGDIAIWGNAPGGTPNGTLSSGVNIGVNLQRSSATAVTIDAGGGNVSIVGAGGDGGTYSHGVLIDGVVVQTSGAGAITVTGKAGASAGGAEQVGVYINGDTFLSSAYSPGTALISGSGGITLIGTGAASGSGGTNTGVRIARATLTATGGDLSVVGTGGAGSNSHSIEIAGASLLATGAGGDISLRGNAPIGTGTGIVLRNSYDGASTTVEIGGASFQGDLTLAANSLSSTATTLTLSHQSGGGTIQFETANAALGIGINGGDPAGGMVIGPGILSAISNFDTLKFGGSGQIGSIQVDNTAFWSLAPSVANFVFQTQGVFYSNQMDFSAQSVTIDAGAASSATVLGATTLTLKGDGNITATVVADAIALDKSGTSADVNLNSSGAMTLAASTMGGGALTLTAGGIGITQTGALVQDSFGGDVTMTSGGTIILSQANQFTGATISIESGSVQITAHQNFTSAAAQIVNLKSNVGNVMVAADLVKSSGTGGAAFNIDAKETAWFANAGIDSDGGNIKVWGNAPGGIAANGTNAGTAWGVRLDGANAILSAGDGNIEVSGKGSTDNGTGQHGIVLLNGAKLMTDSGYMIISGRGGDGTASGAQGIILTGGSQIESQSGYIELYGYGGANSANGHGISLDGGSITNVSGAYVMLNGTGMNGGTGLIATAASTIAAGSGQIGLISNNGISFDGVALSATGGASFVGGTGSIALNNAGNEIAGNLTLATSAGGASLVNNSIGTVTLKDIDVSGNLAISVLGNMVQDATPIYVNGAANFTSFGTITLNNPDNMFGGAVVISSYGNASIATSGALTLDTVETHGYAFTADAGDGLIVASSILTTGGNITLFGNAPGGTFGSSSVANFGVSIDSASAIVDAGGGNIVIKGAGGTAGSHGVTIRNGAGVQTSGAGTLTIEGRGGDGGSGSAGVEFYAGGAYAQTEHGALTVIGTGGSVGYGNTGVALATGELRANGSGDIFVTGTGGGLGSVGVHVGGGGSTMISAGDGTITINATGGGANDSGSISWGLEVAANHSQTGLITTSGVGGIVINATAGGISGDSNRYGMVVGPSGEIVTQFAGISITAIGGTGSGTNNHAVYLDGGGVRTLGASAGISILADSLAAEIGSTVSSLGTVTLAPQTTGADIGIGGGSGVMQLDADLSYITAGKLKIGNASTGLISVGIGGLTAASTFEVYLHGATIFLDGDMTMPSGTLTLHAETGGVIQNTGSQFDVDKLMLRGSGNFTLDGGGSGYNYVKKIAADVTGNLTLRTLSATTYTDAAILTDQTGTITGISATGDLVWDAQGNIGQATGAIVNVGGAVNLEAISGGSITLYESGNVFAGPVGAGAYGGPLSLRAASIMIGSGGIYSAGDLILAATSGAIQQSGALTAGGNLHASAAGGLSLTHASNAVTGNTSLTSTSGDIDWTQSGAMTIGSIASAGTLTVSVTSGSVSQVGAVSTGGDAAFTVGNGNLTLTNASNSFGGPLQLNVTAGSASVTNSGALTLGDVTVGGALTVTAGGALTQLGASFFSAGSTSLSATGTMTLTESGNNFGTALSLTGIGGALDGTVNGNTGASAAADVTAAGSGFTFGGTSIGNSAPPRSTPTEGTTTNTVTTETLAQIITQILTSTVTQPSSSNAPTDATTVNPVSPAAVQAMLIAILAEAASPAGGGETQGQGANTQQPGAQAGAGAQSGTPNVTADTGTFGAGTQITINTSGGTVQSITVTPVGGGAPVTILPGLLNLSPPAIPTATATGTPGISGNFPLAWGGR